MKPTADQLKRGLAASYRLRDVGDPKAEPIIRPTTFTADPEAHVQVIGEAILPNYEDTALIERACLRMLRVLYIDNGFDGGWPHGYDAVRRWRFRDAMRRVLRETLESQ